MNLPQIGGCPTIRKYGFIVILSKAKNLMVLASYKKRFFGFHLRMTVVGQPTSYRELSN